jgi:Leucine-rich repeat (LRR) protein
MKKQILLSLLTAFIFILNAQNVNIPDANFKAYLVGNNLINTNGDTEIQVSEAQAFTGMIYCPNLSISDLTGIEAFTSLNSLHCFGNQITTIDLSNNLLIAGIICFNNNISSLNISSNNLLDNIDCSNNPLTSIDLTNKPNLRFLTCSGNQFTSLDLSNKPDLEYLNCQNNQLTSLDLSGNPNLTEVYVGQNQITSLELSHLQDLAKFSCYNNALTFLNVKNGNNINFTFFDAYGNPNLACIEVDDAAWSTTNWTSIDANSVFSEDCSNCIVFIPDANFKAHLVGNPAINTNGDTEIQCSEAEAFTGMIGCSGLSISSLTGIEAFTNITGLICADNQLTSLDVSANTAITVLECFNNQLTSLNLSSNTALVELTCFNNEITNLDLSNNSALVAVSCQYNQLTSLNLANGNNTNFTYVAASNNPSLTCVKVDNVAYSTANWTEANEFYFDATASFSESCSSSTSINSNSLLQSIHLYPNPANDIVTLVGLPIRSTISVLDVAGRIYKTLQVNAETINININDFANGVYIVNINSNGSNAIKKLIINK